MIIWSCCEGILRIVATEIWNWNFLLQKYAINATGIVGLLYKNVYLL